MNYISIFQLFSSTPISRIFLWVSSRSNEDAVAFLGSSKIGRVGHVMVQEASCGWHRWLHEFQAGFGNFCQKNTPTYSVFSADIERNEKDMKLLMLSEDNPVAHSGTDAWTAFLALALAARLSTGLLVIHTSGPGNNLVVQKPVGLKKMSAWSHLEELVEIALFCRICKATRLPRMWLEGGGSAMLKSWAF